MLFFLFNLLSVYSREPSEAVGGISLHSYDVKLLCYALYLFTVDYKLSVNEPNTSFGNLYKILHMKFLEMKERYRCLLTILFRHFKKLILFRKTKAMFSFF